MGFFSKLFGKFRKSIHVDESDIHLVYLHPNHDFEFNTLIEVQADYNAVFVAKNRVCDVIYPGKFNLNRSMLPGVFERLDLDREDRKKPLKSIKAELYYVNVVEFSNVPYYSNVPFIFKSQTFKRVKGYPDGTFDFKITEPSDFIKFLLVENNPIRNGQAIKYIQRLVGNEISYVMEDIKMPFEEIISDTSRACTLINEELAERFSSIGLTVYNVTLTSLEVPDKIQKKIESYISGGAQEPEVDTQPQLPASQPSEDKSALDKSIEEYAARKEADTVNYCPNCGTKLSEEHNFCPNCGHKKEL